MVRERWGERDGERGWGEGDVREGWGERECHYVLF